MVDDDLTDFRRRYLTALLSLLGCTQDAPTPEPKILPRVGISGVVSYGQGDCMPVIDFSKRSYSPYNGEVYFYSKAALDQLGNGDLAQLKAVSPHYPVRDGQFAAVPGRHVCGHAGLVL
jgi:hypothetical protein